MKKHVNDLLKQIEKNTPIVFDWSNLEPTEKFFYSRDKPINSDTIIINGKMTLSIYSCGCKNCQNITGIHISYGHSSDLKDAMEVKNFIKGEFPNIRIEFIDELDLFRNL